MPLSTVALEADKCDCSGSKFDLVFELKSSAAKYSGLICTAFLALAGHYIKMIADKRQERRIAEIERISRQIESFFGPITGALQKSQAAFDAFMIMYAKTNGLSTASGDEGDNVMHLMTELAKVEQTGRVDLSDNETVDAWTAFQTEQALPVNRQIAEIIATKADLFDGPYPECFMTFLSLVAEREMMVRAWAKSSYVHLRGKLVFPSELDSEIREKLNALANRKAELLGVSSEADSVPTSFQCCRRRAPQEADDAEQISHRQGSPTRHFAVMGARASDGLQEGSKMSYKILEDPENPSR